MRTLSYNSAQRRNIIAGVAIALFLSQPSEAQIEQLPSLLAEVDPPVAEKVLNQIYFDYIDCTAFFGVMREVASDKNDSTGYDKVNPAFEHMANLTNVVSSYLGIEQETFEKDFDQKLTEILTDKDRLGFPAVSGRYLNLCLSLTGSDGFMNRTNYWLGRFDE
jgi:hypothetical protein